MLWWSLSSGGLCTGPGGGVRHRCLVLKSQSGRQSSAKHQLNPTTARPASALSSLSYSSLVTLTSSRQRDLLLGRRLSSFTCSSQLSRVRAERRPNQVAIPSKLSSNSTSVRALTSSSTHTVSTISRSAPASSLSPCYLRSSPCSRPFRPSRPFRQRSTAVGNARLGGTRPFRQEPPAVHNARLGGALPCSLNHYRSSPFEIEHSSRILFSSSCELGISR